jgi:hypothetical protein
MKRLALKKETLGSLDADQLRAVVGGYPTGKDLPTLDSCFTGIWPTLPLDRCVQVSKPTE